MQQGCNTCRWVACRNYGKELDPCMCYIKSLEQEKKEELLRNREKERTS